jgi:hypothetical protein
MPPWRRMTAACGPDLKSQIPNPRPSLLLRRAQANLAAMRLGAAQLTDGQKQALVDLLVVGMYADHNLTAAEDAYLERLLDTFNFDSDYRRQHFVDAAFARTSRCSESVDAARAYIQGLRKNFSSREERRQACEALEELLTSDGKATNEERRILSLVRELFEGEQVPPG